MFDRAALAAAIERHGAVVRVVICAHAGSSPREAGAAMLVWKDGQSGTIGGGALEFDAAARARAGLAQPGFRATRRVPLGPALGQCCGGAVVLGFERFDAAALARVPETGLFARTLDPPALDPSGDAPLSLRRAMARARAQGDATLTFDAGWLAEPVAPAGAPLWLWGAGHVGRAIAAVLAPLPDLALFWIDTDDSRFPADIPAGVTPLVAENPAQLVPAAPADAQHLILTYSHALDLELCHRLLGHGFASCSLIGSATKWARFQSRLRALGHTREQIARIECPIGNPAYGKHPQQIAISVAAALLERQPALRAHPAPDHAPQQSGTAS